MRTCFGPQTHVGPEPSSVAHLRRYGAHPDELVEAVGVGIELAAEAFGSTERVTGWPNCLVRFLRAFASSRVLPRLLRQVVATVQLAHLGAGGIEGLSRQVGGVRAHVGDVAVFVQRLGRRHRALRRVAKLAPGFLLQRRGDERRRWPLCEWPFVDLGDSGCCAYQRFGD